MNGLKEIAERIRNAKNIGIFGHIKTDGDCVGSCLALSRAVELLGKTSSIFIDSDYSEDIKILQEVSEINSKPREKFDLLIALDTATEERLGCNMKYFLKHPNTVQIDHHLDNTKYAKINFIHVTSSSALLVFELIQLLGVKITSEISKFLLLGSLTDTGCLKFRNVDYFTLKTVAEIYKHANFEWTKLVQPVFFSISKRKRLVHSRALSNMKFFHNDKIVVLFVSNNDLKELGATLVDTSSMSFLGLDIDVVEAAIVMTEGEKGVFNITFNSKEKDISAAARSFGGGGHANAAGCKLFGEYKQILDSVVNAVWEVIK